jgi:hypothetical protein
MDDPKRPDATGKCKCDEWKPKDLPGQDQSFRRLLTFFEESPDAFPGKPTDASTKFADDLKDADKESQGIGAAEKKYKEFYDKLDCKLAEAKSWSAEIDTWWADKVDQKTQIAIKDTRKTNYEDKEKTICCAWLDARRSLNEMGDCLDQAKWKEQEAKDDYESVKVLEKTFSDRFAELKSLYDKAKALNTEQRYNALYAVSREYAAAYGVLSVLPDWRYAKRKCSPEGEGERRDLKTEWPPDRFRKYLSRRLRALLLAKYQRVRWEHEFTTKSTENKDKKTACEKHREGRREKFIQEADEMPSSPTPTSTRNMQATPAQLPEDEAGRP